MGGGDVPGLGLDFIPPGDVIAYLHVQQTSAGTGKLGPWLASVSSSRGQ